MASKCDTKPKNTPLVETTCPSFCSSDDSVSTLLTSLLEKHCPTKWPTLKHLLHLVLNAGQFFFLSSNALQCADDPQFLHGFFTGFLVSVLTPDLLETPVFTDFTQSPLFVLFFCFWQMAFREPVAEDRFLTSFCPAYPNPMMAIVLWRDTWSSPGRHFPSFLDSQDHEAAVPALTQLQN